MTQNSTTAAATTTDRLFPIGYTTGPNPAYGTATVTLTTPVTGAQLDQTSIARTEVRSPEGRLILPEGKLNWALHNTWDGDCEGFAEWLNKEAAADRAAHAERRAAKAEAERFDRELFDRTL